MLKSKSICFTFNEIIMNTNYSLCFYLKKPKNYVSGAKPIYLRITVKGIPKEVSIGRHCDPQRWNSKANRIKGSREDVRSINLYLDTIVRKIAEIHSNLLHDNIDVTSDVIKNRFLGKGIEVKTLLQVFSKHNEQMAALLGNGFKPNTLKGYQTSISHLKAYLKKNYDVYDITVSNIDHSFIYDYEFYLRSELGCSEISAAKYIKHLRKIIRICIAHRWINDDPFAFYHSKAKPTKKEFLSKDELFRIEEKFFQMPRLSYVRDTFIFSCYTGLSYADVKKLSEKDVAKGVDGKLWIITEREKTGTASNIPLLSKPLAILERYKSCPLCISKGLLLPTLSNQKMNSYLKEIADLCGVSKTLTFHMARHTFATTVTLSNNVPIETVSKMLGHTDLKTTQHYAKLLDTKISVDMDNLRTKLDNDYRK